MFRNGKFVCIGCFNCKDNLKLMILDKKHLKKFYSVPLPAFIIEYSIHCGECGMIKRTRVGERHELNG